MEINVKKFREQLNMTQQKFANELGVTLKTVQNWEAGRPVPDSIRKLVQYIYKERMSVNNGIIGDGNSNNHIDNRQFYSDSPDVLRAQIDVLEQRIQEKDAQIKEKDAQIKEKDAQIKALLDILRYGKEQ